MGTGEREQVRARIRTTERRTAAQPGLWTVRPRRPHVSTVLTRRNTEAALCDTLGSTDENQDSSELTLGPVERFLAYLTAVGRSPNTVKAYAHGLKDFFEFLAGRGLARTARR